MSDQPHDDDVVARLQSGAPDYPETGPDAARTLAAVRRSLRRRRGRRLLGGVAAVLAVVLGLTAAGPIYVLGLGTFVMPGGYDLSSLLHHGEPPVPPQRVLLDGVGPLQRDVLPVVEELGLTMYINEPGGWGGTGCRVFTWSHGAFRDRDSDCVNPDDPEPQFDAMSEAAFARVAAAVEASGVDIHRIEKGGWGPGTSFHLNDGSWQWNWYYSYIPDTPPDAAKVIREETSLGPRLQVHITDNWWFTVEPDD